MSYSELFENLTKTCIGDIKTFYDLEKAVNATSVGTPEIKIEIFLQTLRHEIPLTREVMQNIIIPITQNGFSEKLANTANEYLQHYSDLR